MPFEYDSQKSRSNKAKHGIDFDEAQMLWHDVDRLEVPAKNVSEPRFAMIGRIGDKVWTAFITYRGDNIRIISIRRARTNEVEAYERT